MAGVTGTVEDERARFQLPELLRFRQGSHVGICVVRLPTSELSQTLPSGSRAARDGCACDESNDEVDQLCGTVQREEVAAMCDGRHLYARDQPTGSLALRDRRPILVAV